MNSPGAKVWHVIPEYVIAPEHMAQYQDEPLSFFGKAYHRGFEDDCQICGWLYR